MTYILVIALAALIVGLAKGGLGPLGALLAPLLASVMPVAEAVGITLPLLIVGDWFALRAYWKTWDMRLVRLLLPGAIVGIILGLTLLTSLSDDALRRVLGVFTLLIAAYKVASETIKRLEYRPHDWHGMVAGSTAGFASALANAGGPPITSYLLLQKLEPAVFVGTSTLFFAIVNLLKLPAFLGAGVIDLPRLAGVLWALALIPVGVWIGRGVITRMNRRVFEWLIFVSLLWAGGALLLG